MIPNYNYMCFEYEILMYDYNIKKCTVWLIFWFRRELLLLIFSLCLIFHCSGSLSLFSQVKTEHADNEAIHSDVVGQVHLENYACKVFLYADNEDRAGRFNK